MRSLMRRVSFSTMAVAILLVFQSEPAASPAAQKGEIVPGVEAADVDRVDAPSLSRRKKEKEEEKKPEGEAGAGPSAQAKKDEPPFDETIKDFEAIPGLFTVYRKDGRYLMAILPDQMDKEFMSSITRETGVGEMGILGVQVLGESPVRFTKVGKRIQMLLVNPRFAAATSPELGRAVMKSFSDSLAGSAKIESAPHPTTKAVLIEMAPFFLTDVEGLGTFLAQRQTPYSVDRENSYLRDVKGTGQSVEVEARVHFAGARSAPLVNVPDSRSFFVEYRYSLTVPVASADFIPRLADDRVGHFLALHQDFSDDHRESSWVRYVTRWNLQKEEPYAARSKPKEPITFWLENSIPKQYRKAVADGVLVWNTAFERIGFTDAIVVKQQPDDADWGPADTTHSTIRWFVATDSTFAIGPSRVNPRTGQIYDADISMTDSYVSSTRQEFQREVDPLSALKGLAESMQMGEAFAREQGPRGLQPAGAFGRVDPRSLCTHASGAAMQASFGHSFLRAAGVQPGSAEEESYVADFITAVFAHEVGHTLGLRHNYRASSVLPVDQLQNAARTIEQGLTGSVMDYTPVNIAPAGTKQGQYWQTTLGAYDNWAIEYAYSVFPGVKTPADELVHLRKIAARVAEPGLLYGTDEDYPDPETSQWDMGTDGLAWHAGRLATARQLWENIPATLAQDGEGFQVMRKAFQDGLIQFLPASLNATKYIGGLHTRRDHVGDPSGRLPFAPVPAQRQREAMKMLSETVFAATAFDLPPDLLNRLAANRWYDFTFSIFFMPRQEFPLHDMVLFIQQATLNQLFSPTKLDRIVDLEMHFPDGQKPFTMAELFDSLHSAIWSEVYQSVTPGIQSFRRALQREHLKRLTDLMLRAPAEIPEDARTMARANLSDLKGRLDGVLRGTGLDTATRAHLEETKARVEAALSAHALRLVS